MDVVRHMMADFVAHFLPVLARLFILINHNLGVFEWIYSFLLRLAAIIGLGSVIRYVIYKLVAIVYRRTGIEAHIRFYSSKEENLSSILGVAGTRPEEKDVARKEIAKFQNRRRMLQAWLNSGKERKSDMVFGPCFILAGAFLFMLMAIKGLVVPRDLDVTLAMITFMAFYLLAYNNIKKRVEELVCLECGELPRTLRNINTVGYYSLLVVLVVASYY